MVSEELRREDPLWPGHLAMLVALVLYVVLPPKLSVGPSWLLPTGAAVLFVGLLGATVIRLRELKLRAEILLVLVLLGTLANLASLGLLTHYLLVGGHARGVDLVDGGAVIWSTNLLLFTIWYWLLDRGGPSGPSPPPGLRAPSTPDFLFPQMSDDRYSPSDWKPGFGDYFYVSLTNQSAFSPTDTMPLTLRMKVLMGIQSVSAFVTVGIVVARAVNILG
jgi:hypothetical protein